MNPGLSYDQNPLFTSLFTEGLANYFSSIVTKDTTLVRILLDDKDLSNRGPKMISKLSKIFIEKIHSKERKDYSMFFTPFQKQEIPNRSGYFLGYLVVKEMAKIFTIKELCLLNEAEICKHVEVTLIKFIDN